VSARDSSEVVLEVFRAIERRDTHRFTDLLHPRFEIQWPPSLPWSGTFPGRGVDGRQGRPTWIETWQPLQPTAAEREMDPRVVAAGDEEVVVLWRQRGRSPAGARFDSPVLGLYQVHEGKLARAQMFYFDPAAAIGFLAGAGHQ
jgi:ketosteroid isomerase-like protein